MIRRTQSLTLTDPLLPNTTRVRSRRRKTVIDQIGRARQDIVHIGEDLRQWPIGRLVDRVTPQAKGARIDLYHDRVHARRDGEIKPLAVALMRLRAGCGRKTAIAVTLNNMFGDRAGFDDDAPVIKSEEHTSELQ